MIKMVFLFPTVLFVTSLKALFFYSRIEDDLTEPSEEAEPFCQVFRGTVCSTHLGNQSIYVTSRVEQGLKEDKMGGRCRGPFSLVCNLKIITEF